MIIIYLQITLENPNFYLTEKMVFLKITIFFLKKCFLVWRIWWDLIVVIWYL